MPDYQNLSALDISFIDLKKVDLDIDKISSLFVTVIIS